MEWKYHLHLNQLGDYWNRREISEKEKERLHVKRVVNYQGFWLSKAVHLSSFYFLYKKGFFVKTSERAFWTNLIGISVALASSDLRICHAFAQLLMFEIEDLNYKYKSEFEDLKKEYLLDKNNKRMIRHYKLQELLDEGKFVKDLMDDRLNK